MQIILTLFLSLISFAQETCDPSIDTNISKCWNESCSYNQGPLVFPADEEELASKIESHKITGTPAELESLSRGSRSFQEIIDKSVSYITSADPDILAKEILNKTNPGYTLGLLFPDKYVFYDISECGSFKDCDYNLNDMLDEEEQKTFSQVADLHRKSVYLFTAIRQMFEERPLPRNEEKEEAVRKLIAGISPTLDPDLRYRLELALNETYLKEVKSFKKNWERTISNDDLSLIVPRIFSQHLSSYLPGLAKAIKIYARERKEAPNYLSVLDKSCKLASYAFTQSKHRDLNQEYEIAKANALKGIEESFLSKMCPEAAGLIRKEMRTILFEFHGLNSKFLPDFQQAENLNNTQFKKIDNLGAFLNARSLINNPEPYLCDVSNFFPTDEYNEVIRTSLFSVLQGMHGVLSHEIGHWLSSQISKDPFPSLCNGKLSNLRKCIRGFYEENSRDMIGFHEGDKLKTEEDFADWFAAVTTKENYACTLRNSASSISSYLGFGKDESELYHPDSTGPHSSPLFRFLNMKIQRGEKLSPSCKSVLQSNPEVRPKKCEL